MININIKTTGIELSSDITNYLNKKLSSLDKFVRDDDTGAEAKVEIGKETNHHKTGNIFFTEINFTIGGKTFRARSNGDSVMSSMDEAKDVAMELLREEKDKNTNKNKKQ